MAEKLVEYRIMKAGRGENSSSIGWPNILEYIPFTKHGEYNGEQNRHSCCHLGAHGLDGEILFCKQLNYIVNHCDYCLEERALL